MPSASRALEEMLGIAESAVSRDRTQIHKLSEFKRRLKAIPLVVIGTCALRMQCDFHLLAKRTLIASVDLERQASSLAEIRER
jgi:hypothetical protein